VFPLQVDQKKAALGAACNDIRHTVCLSPALHAAWLQPATGATRPAS
jgi:hypothetical protein